MERSTRIVVAINAAVATFVSVWLCQNGTHNTKDIIVTLISAVVTGFFSFAITGYSIKKFQLNKNMDEPGQLSETNVDALERLSAAVSGGNSRILESIGKTPDDKTLTSQHKDLQVLLEREIETTERRYTDSERRLRDFTAEQHNMAATVADFRQFLDSWERLTAEANELNYRNALLQEQIENLSHDKQQLQREVQRLQKRKPPHHPMAYPTSVQENDAPERG